MSPDTCCVRHLNNTRIHKSFLVQYETNKHAFQYQTTRFHPSIAFDSVLGTQNSVLPISTSYNLGLNPQTITNRIQIVYQPHYFVHSLKMVSANASKKLQNVLPKCNPFLAQIEYTKYREYCRGLALTSPLPRTS